MEHEDRRQGMTFTTTVQQYNDTQDLFIEIPHYILQNLDWQEGDELAWSIKGNQIILTKIKNATMSEEQSLNPHDIIRKEVQEYLSSESEGKEYKDYDEKYDEYIAETAKETFGQAYHSPEAQGNWD